MNYWSLNLFAIVQYDHSFNSNEWFILAGLVGGYTLILFLPKRYPPAYTLLFLFIGINSGIIFDHTISIPPFDYYDVNDSSKFEIYDFLSYIMYGPFGYLFFYIYDYLKLNGYFTFLYIVMWSIIAMFVEGLATYLGVFHYKNGYQFVFSFPFYFYIQSLTLGLFTLLMKKAPPNK
ncbi:MAG: hypothetical protein ACQEV7_13010 [Bacillota bacterium]